MQKLTLTFILLILLIYANAQQTKIYNDDLAFYKQAKELYTMGNYSLAYPLFKNLQTNIRTTDYANQSLVTDDVNYYATVCGLMQNDTNAVVAAKNYLMVVANTPRLQMMNYHIAQYYFTNQQYNTALNYYNNTTIDNLNNTEIANLKFGMAYCYFTQSQFALAKPLFNTIRQLDNNEHYLDANYYYGFIAYYDKEYKVALESFKKVETHPTYSKVVPFYIAEIYYFTNQKDKAIQYGENILAKNNNNYYDIELRQLVGHGYFEKKEYSKALPYLEKYVNESDKVRREDVYELSYCYYTEKRWAKAIEGFKQLTNTADSLSQNSMYLLGDAYLKVNQKANARTAFAYCAANSSNELQREISKFTYAKLSYELGYTNIALQELKDYLNEFPTATNSNEARELLVAVLTSTNNFREAQIQIESLTNPTESTKKLYPKILYGRAIEYINDQDYTTAETLLNKILDNKYNATVLQPTTFWKGEIAYKNLQLDSAIYYQNNYLLKPETNGEVNATNAKYTLGYAHLRKENYSRALGYFETISNTPTTAILQDAYIRTADCYYMTKDFKKAISMYDNAIGKNWQADYATYQKALAVGITNSNEKIALLKTIDKKYPTTNLIDDAYMEIATTYMAVDKYNEAIPYLNLVTASTDASIKPKALLNLGICYNNTNKNDEAITAYKKLVTQYPNDEYADDALESLEKIYVEKGNATEYADYMRSVGKSISITKEDSLTYVVAEKQYNNNDLNNALLGFENYSIKFANGAFIINANFYTAEIYNTKKDYTNAVTYYETVANKGNSKFAERAISQAAKINYFELKNYAKAETYFTQLYTIGNTQEIKLDALRGLVRSQYYQQKYNETTAKNAKDLIQQKNSNTDDKVLSYMIVAKTQQSQQLYTEAINLYKEVLKLNKAAYAAEARYEIANCTYIQAKYTEAEKAAFEVINKSGSYEIWQTKAYILLGDIYYKQKDYFNAKATLQSIVENTTLPNLKKEAQVKLAIVVAEEQSNSKIKN